MLSAYRGGETRGGSADKHLRYHFGRTTFTIYDEVYTLKETCLGISGNLDWFIKHHANIEIKRKETCRISKKKKKKRVKIANLQIAVHPSQRHHRF